MNYHHYLTSRTVSFLWVIWILHSPQQSAEGFQNRVVHHAPQQQQYCPSGHIRTTTFIFSEHSDAESSDTSRRTFLTTTVGSTLFGLSMLVCPPEAAWAGVDVSGLRTEGGGVNVNSDLASQLKAYDGSGITRVREVKSMQEISSLPVRAATSSTSTSADDRVPMAQWAYRANPGFNPSLTRAGAFGNLYHYSDMVQGPPLGSKRRAIGVQFEFPSDWLQLDRSIGGIQYVDQRNGDKLYVFRAPLPADADTTLETISKATIGDYIFNSKASLAQSGQTIEDYKVTSSQILSHCPNQMCATRRRFQIKYATVTGNGLRVERRALVDAYQVENDIYMLMTSSNAVKFDQKDSPERETVEKIVSSFQVDV